MLLDKNIIDNAIAGIEVELIKIRRHLHQHPELSFQEYETNAYITHVLDEWGIPYTNHVAGTGIVVILQGVEATKSKCIALRADIDALPITELNDIAYVSQNRGIMHACGHDVHTTVLLGAIKILNTYKNQWKGTIKCIFQPGEEQSPGGASLMIKDGVLKNPQVDAIVGLHVFPELPVGHLGFRAGEYMASTDELHLKVIGKGGHAALPHKCVDPIVIAANIIMALQQVVSRKSNALTPAVLSFGKIAGGHANNVIPNEVVLEGTLRTFDENFRKEALELIELISKNTAQAFGGDVEFTTPPGYPSLYNDIVLTEKLKLEAQEIFGKDQIHELDRRMTAEDFSFYTHHTKGCFFRLGTNSLDNKYGTPVHNAHFNVEEKAIGVGVKAMTLFALKILDE
jgi:amidohydrolase